jgi:hypothetical protein
MTPDQRAGGNAPPPPPLNPPATDATLRDLFAAEAMAAMISGTRGAMEITDDQIAIWAYMQADAMLARRRVKP